MQAEAVNPQVDLTTVEASQKALRVFFRIANAWGLSNADQIQLLGTTRTRFFVWKSGGLRTGLDNGTLERLSLIFGIYSALLALLPIPERANAWIRKRNSAPLFGGESALKRMLGGQVSDLYVVRQYLDTQRGGWS
jgi:hypothetical protein